MSMETPLQLFRRGFDTLEIAERLGMPEWQVASRIDRERDGFIPAGALEMMRRQRENAEKRAALAGARR